MIKLVFSQLMIQMKAEKPSIHSRIQTLLKSKSLLPPPQKEPQQLPTYHLDTYSPVQVSQNALLGKIVGGVVVGKNEPTKQLTLHLTTYYDHSKKINISPNCYVAFIRDYELKADLSIFGYLNNFKDVEIGTYINAWVRRLEKRDNNKTYFELHLNRQADNKSPNIKLGVVKDNVKIPETVLKVYEKQQMLPLNFLILYENGYDNPGLQRTFEKGLNIESLSSLHRVSNLSALQQLDYNYHRLLSYIKLRIRQKQQKEWRDQHLELGLECMKEGKHQYAIDLFNISLKFDPDFVETHIAKACTYMAMGMGQEAIRAVKEALRIDPQNERARKYYFQFQKETVFKNDDELAMKKKGSGNGGGSGTGNGYKLMHHK